MRYELDLILQLCNEVGLPALVVDERVEITLGPSATLWFQNADKDEDCLMAFEGTGWHMHDYFCFVDARGYEIELDYLDIVTGLKDGRLLVCERWQDGALRDRWLTHRDFNNEFKYMREGEELRVWRPMRSQSKASPCPEVVVPI